jgi:hypothetical protein
MGHMPQARGRASPAPSAGAARGGTGPLPGGRGVQTPEAGWSGLACDGPAITRGGPGPLGSPGPQGLPESSSALLGMRRPRTSKSTGKVRRPWPQLSSPGRMPRHPEDEGEITYGDTLRAWTP